ncbi:MAG: hypothetical protein COW73_03930 [Nitrospirae bacterium CG18_big_fil_WC_8_21_14_2_50_70_55]|nr:hypothetical protein [Deltaproteobacteria bacterium]OIP64861.1 MAG: hypothetical protein AUK30_05910 [Nitrospirae bacterium CG2_30_70_394]PIQ06189.1 MAG: hypothetical protein COW73_03930 [Nitrospirae bacterium CG18_big_fil_WC_8_21_14_2_50_70_55]PIU80237.1 MAG: hypothetical protein COS73_00320 [Nitrospirae bacterium CG06_land_8_20_14_3_00_70_43]PIW83115.1 MAG: hypothetical protein COZ96_05070 [Nitrospirae bacterium CG_4_8_14_3_um_filter_70_85]PIX83979.1 MAG: hypothetical protein COZ33_02645 
MATTPELLSRAAQGRIAGAVAAAEQATSGEIVVTVVPESNPYPRAELLAALIAGVAVGLAVTLATGSESLFRFLPTALAATVVALGAVRRWPVLKRPFVSPWIRKEEVHQRAIQAFFDHRLYQTAEATGVLLFLSLFERRVELLADQGIDTRVPRGSWDAIVAELTTGLRRGVVVEATVAAVEQIGALLATHAPPRAGDTNELPDGPRLG